MRFQINKRNGQIITQELIDKSRISVNLKESPAQPIDIIYALAGHPNRRQATYLARGKQQCRQYAFRSVYDGALCFKRHFGTDYATFTKGLDYLHSVNYIFKRYCNTIRKDTFCFNGTYRDISLTNEQIKTFNDIILGKND